MKSTNRLHKLSHLVLTLGALAFCPTSSDASVAYGSINNFDTVNDTGEETHGFEIEVEDCHSTDVTYTFDYNHYGTSHITQDDSIPGHPKTHVRWESKKNPDGSWAAKTIVPTGPISPTNGHQFTNPAVNFGGEHFGTGFRGPVGAVRYFWLVDRGGVLTQGPAVQVSTPTFTYYPQVVGVAAPAQVQAVIAPPPPPAPEPKEFGKAVWMKEIKTTTHNAEKVKLRELLSEDPDHPEKKNWKNGEPDEVEVEWRILQKKYSAADGGPNNEVPAAAEDLPGGNEVVTRRYEFFKYVGPLDAETGEAMGDLVGADGIHGSGSVTYADHINPATGDWVTVTTDLSTVEVVGEFTGSQMAAVDVDAAVGLIDHVSEGKVGAPYTARRLVVEGTWGFACVKDGALPAGMTFNENTSILSGTPTVSGDFAFKVTAKDGVNPDVAKNYTLRIAPVVGELGAKSLLDTAASPIDGGTTSGDGSFASGTNVTVNAVAAPGFHFVNWTDNADVVSTTSAHSFIIDVNHSLVAHFAIDVPQWTIAATAVPVAGGTITGSGLRDQGTSATLVATANVGYSFTNWTDSGAVVSTAASYSFNVTGNRTLVANFSAIPTYTVTTSATAGGTASGGGTFSSGTSTTVTATPNAGYVFIKWTVGGAQVSTLPSYAFNVTANKALVANFVIAGTQAVITTSASPLAYGTTSGGGNYLSGDTATVVATENPFRKFTKWQEGGATVSTSPSYTFTVGGSRTLVAKFTEAFVITANTSPAIGGTTEMDSLTYKTGENAKAKAFPASGYSFANWTENGDVVSTSDVYDFNVTGNRTIIANFVSDTGVTVTANAAPEAAGSVGGDATFSIGDSVTVSAVANPGFAFASWTAGGTVVSTDADYTFNASAHRALVAHFAPAIAITSNGSPAAGGTVYGAGEYPSGQTATLEAMPNSDFEFRYWTEGGTIVSTSENYTFTVNTPRTVIANFAPTFPVFTAAWPTGGGSAEGGGRFTNGSLVTVSATPAPGFAFDGWTADGLLASTARNFSFSVANGGRSIVANFSEMPKVIPVPAGDAAHLIVVWPENAVGYVLEESTDLVTWTPSSRAITTAAGQKSVSVPTTGANTYFRLKRP